MGIGKYHCDYCDKEFQDTPAARKRHLQGIQHQRNRSLWYVSFNKVPIHYAASSQAIVPSVCNRFLNTGACPYGDSCKYAHPNQNLQLQRSVYAHGQPVAGNPEASSFGMSLGNLPPSLRPPTDGGFPPLPFVDWG